MNNLNNEPPKTSPKALCHQNSHLLKGFITWPSFTGQSKPTFAALSTNRSLLRPLRPLRCIRNIFFGFYLALVIYNNVCMRMQIVWVYGCGTNAAPAPRLLNCKQYCQQNAPKNTHTTAHIKRYIPPSHGGIYRQANKSCTAALFALFGFAKRFSNGNGMSDMSRQKGGRNKKPLRDYRPVGYFIA